MTDPDPSSGIYRVEEDATPPDLPGRVTMRADAHDVHTVLAADLMIHANNCVRAFGDFHLALSGGSTPMPFYERLMVDPAYRAFPWKRTHLWIVDERRVPETDERSNFKHIAEILVDHSDIPPSQVHPMRAHEEDADKRYERELREILEWREPGHDRLDFVLLGMGDDGHTASLFPNSPALGERERLVTINDGAGVTPPRVTMTYKLINASRFIAVLVTGAKKAPMLARVAQQKDEPNEIPVLGVRPLGGEGATELSWYVDEDACRSDD
jgi:6-phosphogluconolactonase